MNGFEFTFTLFGLLLGLALAEALGGLAKAMKASHKVRIGWPTALLGIFVSFDVVTFWMFGWALHESFPVTWRWMFGGFIVTAIYYVSASLIFPDDSDGWADLDGHFDRHYRKVLAGILICNMVLMAANIELKNAPQPEFRTFIVTWSFYPVSLLAIAVRGRRVVVACLIWLILLNPLSVVWT